MTQRRCIRHHLVVRLRPGVVPDRVPTHLDVLEGHASPQARVDHARVDGVLRGATRGMQVSRVFSAAQSVYSVGARHHAFDELEERLGLSRTLRIRLDDDADLWGVAQRLSDVEAVEMATPDYLCETPFSLTEPRVGQDVPRDYAHTVVGAAQANHGEPGDAAVIVAVVDSGVQHSHPELASQLRPGLDVVDLPATDVDDGIQLLGDYQHCDRVPEDENGHGTSCAGIIAARGERVAPGVAGRSRLLPVRALAAARVIGRQDPTAIGGIANIDAAVKAAVDLGAQVINLSFGTPESQLGGSDPVPHVEVVRYALARGCVLVAASGNSGDDERYFPAALPGVIAVGAVDAQLMPTSFSTRGRHVSLCAPGYRVWCATIDGYTYNSGTSFAAPFVAGAAALLLSRGFRASVRLTPFEVKEILERSSKPHAPSVSRELHGAGVLDIPAALARCERLLMPNVDEVGSVFENLEALRIPPTAPTANPTNMTEVANALRL